MVPYNIHCATCHRTLTVRSAAAIGKILACPQCGSMVMVEPPAGVPRQGVAPAVSSKPLGTDALEADNFDAMLLAAQNPQLADTVPDGTEPPVRPNAITSHAPPPLTAGEPAIPSLRPDTDWASAEARQMRKWLLIGAVSIAGAVILIIGGGFWLTRGSNQSSEPLAAGPQRESDSAPPPADAKSGDATKAEPDSIPKGPEATEPDPNPPQAPSGAGTETVEPDKPVGDPPGGVDRDLPPPDAPAPMPPVQPDSAGPPLRNNIAGARAGLSAEAALKEFEGLMSDTTFDRGLAMGESLFDLIPSPGRPFDMTRAMPKPAPLRAVNIDAQLGIRIPEMEFTNIPLQQFLQFVGDFTNLPITVEIDGLHRLGLPVLTPVNATLHDGELRSAIIQVLNPLGLELVVDGQQLVVLPRGARDPLERTYDVYDLVGEDPDAVKFLTDLIFELLAPASWERNGGGGKLTMVKGRLTVFNTAAIQHEVLMLCERLRIARGDRPQGSLPPHMLDLQPRVGLALTQLGLTVSASFATPVRFTEILDHLSESSGMQFVVNWHSMAELGWHPGSLARLEVSDVSLSEALQELLGPMELSFRVIDATTLQITTAKEAFRALEVELFPVAKAFEPDEGRRLLQGVRSILGDPAVSRDASGEARFDTGSKTLILVAPQHRMAAIAGLLDRLVTPAPATPAEVLPVIE